MANVSIFDVIGKGRQDSSATQPDDPSYRSLMDSMVERHKKLPHTPCNWSICRVPCRLREPNKDAYTPRIVSIGPFHSGEEKLQAMEARKTWYMESLFQRTRPEPIQTFFACAKAILSMEESAHRCYFEEQPSENLKKGKLAEILLVDGCFILELLLRWTTWRKSTANSCDPIFGSAWMINCLQRDLVLLENQIPFFVLQCLFDLIVGRIPNCEPLSLHQICVSFHLPLNLNEQASLNNNGGVRHLLDAIRNYYLPSYPKTKPMRDQSWESIHCATKLRESGIKFVKGSSDQLFGIKFNSTKGVLEIPLLLIQDATESLLRNLVAFEQCCHGTSHLITSYIMLMDRLIDSPRDAEYLEKKRIIANHLGSGEDASQFFNNMFKEVVLEDFFFEALCEDVNIYYNRRWPRYKAFLTRNHCSNPWRTLSVVAACVLLGLAAVQTGYTAASFYPH